MRFYRFVICCLLIALVFFWASFSWARKGIRLRLATTTSLENSGLLEVLLRPFEKEFGLKVDVIAVGTGKALRLGENGDVDLLLVHDRQAEEKFVKEGFGVNRRVVMYNEFVIVGPADDPAKIRGVTDAPQALKRIAIAKFPFVSRGDDSGTHKKEILLWKKAKIKPGGKWYLESGQGMGATLRLADEKQAYCLVDRGTSIFYQKKVDLTILSQADSLLYNPYGVIAVNPAKHPQAKYVYSMALIGWLTSVPGQRIIANYKKFGQELFHPVAITKPQ